MFDIFDTIYEATGISYVMETIRKKCNISTPDNKEEKQVYHSAQITPKKYSFRPQTLEQYIGQENPKALIEINLQKIRTIKAVHFIVSGSKGTGKSTLAYIIAKNLGLEIMTYVAGSFTMDNLRDFLIANSKSEKPMILFVDEIHGLARELGEFMFPLLEDFILPIGNQKVRPFIFIGCTTDLHILQKRLAPMIDRCQSINLTHYTVENMKEILKQYNEKTYQMSITDEEYNLLSRNSRYTPRILLSLVDDFSIVRDVKKVLSAHQIIIDSLNINDIIVLRHLAEMKQKPVGVEVLAIITQQTKQDYMTLQEPFLIMEQYISRGSRGRSITEKGMSLLRSLDEKF